jgi:hypothetical protein
MGKAPKKKIVSVNLSHALFFRISLLLKIVPIGSTEPLVMNYHSVLRNISEEWMSHMIWWCRTFFGSMWSSSEQSSLVLHTRIEDNLTYLSAKFKGKTSSCIRLNTVFAAFYKLRNSLPFCFVYLTILTWNTSGILRLFTHYTRDQFSTTEK